MRRNGVISNSPIIHGHNGRSRTLKMWHKSHTLSVSKCEKSQINVENVSRKCYT
jgi:hypothetical protein